MSIPVKPTQRTLRERIEADVSAGNLRAVAGLPERLDAFAALRASIESSPYVRSEKARLVAEAEARLLADKDAIVDAEVRAAGRELDAEEGQLRADGAAVGDIEASVLTRGRLMVAQIEAARDPHAILSVYDDALFTEHADLIRVVGMAAESRLHAMAARNGGTASPSQVAWLRFRDRFDAWQRSHPSPRQRVEGIGRERHNRRVTIEASAAFMLRLYGVGRPAVASPAHDPRIVEGPAFDALAGRIRNNVRR